MKALKEKVIELQENQNHMLKAITNLNERLEGLEKRENEVQDILESQAMIDEILVKNSDDITVIKKTKEDNAISIKNLDAKIVIYFPIFSWNTSTHLGHEVIKPKCLNTSKNFWASSVSGPVEVTNSCVQSL